MADDQFQGRRLYYVKNIFILTVGATVFEIEEPIGWDKVKVSITFDKIIKGFKFEFSDVDTTLEFDNACGFKELKAAYDATGIDSQATLKFGEINDDVITIWYEAKLDFSTYVENLATIKLQCERDSLGIKFMSRRDTQFEVEKSSSLGNLVQGLEPLPTYNCFLHNSFINKKAGFVYNTSIKTTDPPPMQNEVLGGGHKIDTTVPPLQSTSNEIQDFEDPLDPQGELIYAGTQFPKGVTKRNISFSGLISLKSKVPSFTGGGTYMRIGLKIYKKTNISSGDVDDNAFNDPAHMVVLHDTFYEYTGVDNNFLSQYFTWDVKTELLLDEAIFIKVYTDSTGLFNSIIFFWDKIDQWKMNVQSYSFITPITYPAYKIFDVLDRMFTIVTDRVGVFKSDHFKTGLGRDHFLNSGQQIRKVPKGVMPASMKDVLPSCDTLWNMGGSFERDNNGNEWFRFEPMGYFFRDIEMIKLDVISKYVKTPALDYTYNELEFGFKKYPQDNGSSTYPGSAFDFMSKFNFSTMIKNYQGKLSQICQILLSPYYINYAIQNSFDTNPSNQYETDNDLIMISHRKDVDNVTNSQVHFIGGTNQIIIEGGLPIVNNEAIKILSAALNSVNQTVQNVVWDNLNGSIRTVIYLDKSIVLVEETVVSDVTYPDKWVPKRDEQFDSITGVDSPSTVYNLQHHIKIIFKRWAKYFLGGLIYEKDSATDPNLLQYLSSSNNKDVSTTLKVTEAQTPMSPVFRAANPTSPDKDSGDERPSDLEYPIFGRSYITFEAPLTWQLLDRLRKAFEGRDPEDKDYGYFSILNPYNVYEKGYLVDLKFDPSSQNTSIKLIEKYNG